MAAPRAVRKLSRCADDDDGEVEEERCSKSKTPPQRQASASANNHQSPGVTESTTLNRRSSKNVRSSFRQLQGGQGEEAPAINEEPKQELDDKEDEVVIKVSTIDPDPLSRKSSEGLRWISNSKLGDKETEIRGSTVKMKDGGDKPTQDESRGSTGKIGDGGDKPTQGGSVKEIKPELSEFIEVEEEEMLVRENGSNLKPIGTALAEPEDSGLMDNCASLPSAPSSMVNRQSLAAVCFSTCLTFLLCILAILMMYSRWTATPTVATPTSDEESRRQKVAGASDDSGCDSLFSFSRCSNSDMLG